MRLSYSTALFKGIVHFEINFWYVLAYLKGIQDVGVFVSTAFSIMKCFGQTVLVCQSSFRGSTSKSMHRKVKIKHDLMTRKFKYTWPKARNKWFMWGKKTVFI